MDQLPPWTLMFSSIVIPIYTRNCLTADDWSPDKTISYFLGPLSSSSCFFLSLSFLPSLSCSLIWPWHLKFWVRWMRYLFTELDYFFQVEFVPNTSDGSDVLSTSGLDFGDVYDILLEVIELLSALEVVEIRH